jgi:hypothetical protein
MGDIIRFSHPLTELHFVHHAVEEHDQLFQFIACFWARRPSLKPSLAYFMDSPDNLANRLESPACKESSPDQPQQNKGSLQGKREVFKIVSFFR